VRESSETIQIFQIHSSNRDNVDVRFDEVCSMVSQAFNWWGRINQWTIAGFYKKNMPSCQGNYLYTALI
jgi:hypothetical protein